MVVTKLNIKLVPYFIYLVDDIIEDCKGFVDCEMIVDRLRNNYDYIIHEKSIERAFILREQLKKNDRLTARIWLPHKKTLDALTKYLYNGDYEFRDLILNKNIGIPKEKIESHYLKNRPTNEILNAIFKPRPEKIKHIESQIYICEECKTLVERMNDEAFNLKFKNELKDKLKSQNEIIAHLEMRITSLEKKQRQATWVYRIFGTFGLFFVAIDYRELSMDIILSDVYTDSDYLVQDDNILHNIIKKLLS